MIISVKPGHFSISQPCQGDVPAKNTNGAWMMRIAKKDRWGSDGSVYGVRRKVSAHAEFSSASKKI